VIRGNAGNNLLLGMNGDDDLYGGKGTDTMKGGIGIDTFHFVTGDGHDTVGDFVSGTDKIDVSHWAGIDTFAHLKAHAADGADGLVITMGDDTLTIANLTRNHLDAGDFVFPH
jgi:Ca2+-binding RTX toxin-like protein